VKFVWSFVQQLRKKWNPQAADPFCLGGYFSKPWKPSTDQFLNVRDLNCKAFGQE
jgi:hypothetical protein